LRRKHAIERSSHLAQEGSARVLSFDGWLKAGRVVRKGPNGIRILAPDTIDDGKVTRIKPVYVLDVTQTQELRARAA
jgi:hypothetical protein